MDQLSSLTSSSSADPTAIQVAMKVQKMAQDMQATQAAQLLAAIPQTAPAPGAKGVDLVA
jgi:hypothetical protein